jgi:hypothetical protein
MRRVPIVLSLAAFFWPLHAQAERTLVASATAHELGIRIPLAQPDTSTKAGSRPDIVITATRWVYRLHVGQGLLLWEPGIDSPAAHPHIDRNYLRLSYRKHLGPCPAHESCIAPPGFVWRYVAIQAGRTWLALVPACRSAVPPCMIAERAITLNIFK